MPAQFEFVTISRPDDIKNSNVRTRIKVHAGRSNPRQKSKRNKNLHDSNAPEPTDLNTHGAIELENELLKELPTSSNTNSLWNLTAGFGYKPFQTFPFRLSAKDRHLVDFVIYDFNQTPCPLFALWASVSFEDTTTFNLFLARASVRYDQVLSTPEYPKQKTLVATEYYSKALRQVQKRLRDPKDGVSEGVIGAVLTFACQDAQGGEMDRWLIHMQGLKKIIDQRGGIATLATEYFIRLSMFWIDINGGLAMDMRPQFPFPTDIVEMPTIETIPTILGSVSKSLVSYSEILVDICNVFALMSRMSSFFNEQGMVKSFFNDDQAFIKVFVTVVYQALLLAPQKLLSEGPNEEAEVMNEMMRLASLLYLALVKRRIGVPPDCVERRRDALLDLLRSHPLNLTKFLAVQLWVLVILAVATDENDRESEIDQVKATMRKIGLRRWSDAERIVRGISWVNDIQDGSCALAILGAQVQ